MESLFGAETPLAVRFFIAFIVVFALIGVTAWLVRRFGTGRLGSHGARGRAPRLAVIEAGAVDGRRKLVLIRRDNIEHLIMIGGPTDIVVEQNIVRGQAPARESASARSTGTNEILPRAVPLGEETSWPLAPEPASRAARAPRPPVADESLNWSPPAEPVPAPRRQRQSDTLAGLAAELSTRPSVQPESETPKARVAPKLESLRATPPATPAPAPTAPAHPAAAPDQNLADMAQRLEAALRRPGKPGSEAAAVPPAPQRAPAVNGARERAAETPQPAPEQPAKKPDNVFGSLEEEMASLLGRPPGKT